MVSKGDALVPPAVSVLLTAPTAKAHMLICGERRDFIDQLKKQHDEKRAVFGLTSNGRLIEVFVGPSGSWTILTSDPTGISCVLARIPHLHHHFRDLLSRFIYKIQYLIIAVAVRPWRIRWVN